MQATLAEIVQALGGKLQGSPDTVLTCIMPLSLATPQALSFLSHARYAHELQTTQAGAVIVSPESAPLVHSSDVAGVAGVAGVAHLSRPKPALIVTPEPYLYYARLSQWWAARIRENDHADFGGIELDILGLQLPS